MVSIGAGSAVLFLAGDPALAAQRAATPESMAAIGRLFPIPPSFAIERRKRRATSDPIDTHGIPAEQVVCAQRTLDAATKLGRKLKIVDVNHPDDDADLVKSFVGPDDILPILVRADGGRLAGEEAFTPGNLREFLAKA